MSSVIVGVCPALHRPPQGAYDPLKTAPIAQLDRASGYEPGGRTFESCWAHQPSLMIRCEGCLAVAASAAEADSQLPSVIS